MSIRHWLLVVGFLAWIPLAACEHADPISDMPDPGMEPDPDPEATFSRIQATIFNTSCALSGCHAGGNPQQGMSLSQGQAYSNIVGVASTQKPALQRVNPGNPDESYLLHKVEGRSDISGQRMPLGGSALSSDQIQLIRDWIAEGAENN